MAVNNVINLEMARHRKNAAPLSDYLEEEKDLIDFSGCGFGYKPPAPSIGSFGPLVIEEDYFPPPNDGVLLFPTK